MVLGYGVLVLGDCGGFKITFSGEWHLIMGGGDEPKHQVDFSLGGGKGIVRLDGNKIMRTSGSVIPHDAVGGNDISK